MKHETSNISNRIHYALHYAQVRKLSALALEIGVDESAISRWKKTGNISINNASSLCKILDISLDWVILGRGDIQQHKQFIVTESEREMIYELRKLEPESTAHIIRFLKGFISGRGYKDRTILDSERTKITNLCSASS